MRKYLFILIVIIISMLAISCKKNNDDPTDPDNPRKNVDGYFLYGYCDKLNVVDTLAFDGQDSCEVAVLYKGSELISKGKYISGVRMYVVGATQGTILVVDSVGRRIDVQDFTISEPGWQFFLFYNPLEIEIGRQYYIGYCIKGRGFKVGVDSLHDSSSADVSYVYDGKEWHSFVSLGIENKILSAEVVCQGGDYSGEVQHKYLVTGCDFPANVQSGQKVDFNVTIMSLGIKTTHKLTLTCTCGKDVLVANASGLHNGESKKINFTLESVDADMREIVYEIVEDSVSEKYSGRQPVTVSAD